MKTEWTIWMCEDGEKTRRKSSVSSKDREDLRGKIVQTLLLRKEGNAGQGTQTSHQIRRNIWKGQNKSANKRWEK